MYKYNKIKCIKLNEGGRLGECDRDMNKFYVYLFIAWLHNQPSTIVANITIKDICYEKVDDKK